MDRKINLPTGNERILFVDDEAFVIDPIQQMLTRLGYQVVFTTDPLEALALVENDPSRFDLVITDLTMPHLTGDRLSEKIIALRPDMPIILCTGYGRNLHESKARDIGITHYQAKPIEIKDLAMIIREVLDGSVPVSPPAGH